MSWPEFVGGLLGILVYVGLAWRYGAAKVTAVLTRQPQAPRWLTFYGVAICAVLGMLIFGLAIRVAVDGWERPIPSKYVPMAGS